MLPAVVVEGAAVAGPAALSAAKTVARKAVALARAKAPQAYEQAKSYLAASGKDIDNLAASKNQATQGAVVTALFKSGLSVQLFREEAQLTEVEARQYSQMMDKFHRAQTANVDRNQVARPSTGDAYLDQLATNLEIEDLCIGLGISSDMYAKLIRGVRTHTSNDIERFQLDRRMRRQKVL